MKLIAIADTHEFHRSLEIPAGDVLIHAGDLTRQGSMEKALELNDLLDHHNYHDSLVGKLYNNSK